MAYAKEIVEVIDGRDSSKGSEGKDKRDDRDKICERQIIIVKRGGTEVKRG